MELFSLMGSMAWPVAALSADANGTGLAGTLNRPEMQQLGGILVLSLVLSQIIAIACYWVASRIVIDPEDATVGRAFLLWICYILVGVGIGVLLVIALPMAISQNTPWKVFSVAAGIGLLSLALIFLVPMKVYSTGFLRALGLVLLAGIFQFVINVGFNFTLPMLIPDYNQRVAELITAFSPEAFKSGGKPFPGWPVSQEDEIDRLLGKANPASGPRPSLRTREATVRELQVKLNERKKNLPRGDTDAAKKFQDQLSRYLRLLEEVKFELAAQPKGPPR